MAKHPKISRLLLVLKKRINIPKSICHIEREGERELRARGDSDVA
jgi:hypothetical protein